LWGVGGGGRARTPHGPSRGRIFGICSFHGRRVLHGRKQRVLPPLGVSVLGLVIST